MKSKADWAVDVAIPLHNKAPFIEKTVRSAMEQSVPVRAIYVADDASSDDGPEIVRRLAAEDRRVHFLLSPFPEASGECATRNRALHAGSSEIVAFIDADDWWDSDYVERQLSLLTSEEIGLVHNAGRLVDGLTEAKKFDMLPPPLPAPEAQFDEVRLERYWVGCPSAVLVRRRVFDVVGDFPEHLSFGGDWDMWARFSGVTRFAQNLVPGANIRVLPTYSRTRSPIDRFLLWVRVFDRWSADHTFIDKAVARARFYVLMPQLTLLLQPRALFVDFPRRLREEGGAVGLRMFPTPASYWLGLASIPFHLIVRALRKFRRSVLRQPLSPI